MSLTYNTPSLTTHHTVLTNELLNVAVENTSVCLEHGISALNEIKLSYELVCDQ